jgi:hypothetical protein
MRDGSRYFDDLESITQIIRKKSAVTTNVGQMSLLFEGVPIIDLQKERWCLMIRRPPNMHTGIAEMFF